MTFLGHTISLSERSDSETCLDKLSRKLTKLSFMGLAKARRAMYLTRFGKISITRALICSYWNYFASHFPLKKQHSKFAQRNIDDYITYKCHFLAGEAKYAPLRYGGGVFCPSTNPWKLTELNALSTCQDKPRAHSPWQFWKWWNWNLPTSLNSPMGNLKYWRKYFWNLALPSGPWQSKNILTIKLLTQK